MMNNTNKIFIFITVLLSFLVIGCEQQADLTKSAMKDIIPLSTRGVDDCSECPNMDDCCCKLTYSGSGTIMLKICGTTDGDATTCQDDVDGCETIDGLSHSYFELSPGEQIELFCMLMVRGFYIENLTGSTVNLTLTCQSGALSPQTLIISIPAYSTKYYQTDSECEVEECGH